MFTKPTKKKMEEKPMSCNICGGVMVEIRGRYPENHLRRDRTRIVCPTCLADRMDNIREIASPDYGKCCTSDPTPQKQVRQFLARQSEKEK